MRVARRTESVRTTERRTSWLPAFLALGYDAASFGWPVLILSTLGVLAMMAGYVVVIIYAMQGYPGPANCLGPLGPP